MQHLNSTKHDDENAVKEIKTMKINIPERRVKFAELKNGASHLWNIRVLTEGHGELMLKRRPTSTESRDWKPIDFRPCPYRKAWQLRDHQELDKSLLFQM